VPLLVLFAGAFVLSHKMGIFPVVPQLSVGGAGPVTPLERSWVSATECPLLLTVYRSGATVL
jgi:hypothetical protein